MPLVTASRVITDSAQIVDGIVTNADIATNAAIAATKIQALDLGTNGGVIPSTGIVNAHIAAAAAIVLTKLAAGTQGGVLVPGASGVITDIGAGTDGQVLTSGGAGVTAGWENAPVGWDQLGETTLGGAASSITVSSLSARKDLSFRLFIPSMGATGEIILTFNSDTGTNYGWRSRKNGTAWATGADDTGINLMEAAFLSTLTDYEGRIQNNAAGTMKTLHSRGIGTYGNDATAPEDLDCVAVWNNTAAQITALTFTHSASTFASGTRLTVYGKKD